MATENKDRVAGPERVSRSLRRQALKDRGIAEMLAPIPFYGVQTRNP